MTATHLARTLAVILLCCSSAAFAETFPTRGIKVVVPFSAAGVQDIVTRIIFDRFPLRSGSRSLSRTGRAPVARSPWRRSRRRRRMATCWW